MASPEFAAAQERILARRRQTRLESRQDSQASNASNRLPFPLEILGRQGIEAWNLVRGREGTRPALRVGQVDAELLDEELLELLRGQVGEGLKFFGPHLKDEWASEILLGLRTVLFKFTIWDNNASYGASLQNLRYIDATNKGPVPRAPSRLQKACYGLFAIGGRYAWTRWENWLAQQEGDYEEPSSNVRLFSRLSSLASTTHSIAAFASFLVFLFNGRYRTLLDRILHLRLAPHTKQVTREVSFEYLNRQLVWHAFTEFLLFLLPLVGISRWRRLLSRIWRKIKTAVGTSGTVEEDASTAQGEYAFLPERTCAICYQDQNSTSTSENEVVAVMGASGGVVGSVQTDVTSPYETFPCGCVYCYVCIATRLESTEGEGWICLRCGYLVKECRPWAGDVLTESTIHTNRKTVSFSEEGGKQPEGKRIFEDDHSIGSYYAVEAKADQIISDESHVSREWAHQGSDTFAADVELEG
ncbi:peroxisome assembly protein (Peroxin-2) [Pseudocyphellaria aurata]|nr:peroxisome assembly protein (Peroxin-2) [Pseudocyphellaria aurata]